MSSQQSSSSRPAMPKTYFSNMVFLLRRANARYAEAATSFRRAYQPKHHARKLAQKLELTVSIDAAKAIDPRQVSVIPLPVLATPVPALEPSPVIYHTAATRRSLRPVLDPLVIPGKAVVGREREIKRLSEVSARRPVLRCSIPTGVVPQAAETLNSCVSVSLETPASTTRQATQTEIIPSGSLVAQAPRTLRGQNVPWRPITSRWSATDSELSAAVETTTIQTEEQAPSAITFSSDYSESMTDLETPSPIVAERISSEAGRVVFLPAAVPQAKPHTPSVRSRKNPSLRLDAPTDATDRYSWSSDVPYSALTQASNSPSSPSSSSSGGPVTPGSGGASAAAKECPYSLPLLPFQAPTADAQPRPRVGSVKRKCSQSFIDMSYGEGEVREHAARDRLATADKRTKYQRKHWMNPAAAALRGPRPSRTVLTPASGSADAESSFWQ